MNVAQTENATEAQWRYIADLRERRDFRAVDNADIAWLDVRLVQRDLSKIDASKTIARLLKLPKRADAGPTTGERVQAGLPDVPEGRYALPDQPDNLLLAAMPVITFWRVDRPTEGKWAGKTFLKPVFGGPGSLRYGPNVYGQARQEILSRIAADPAEAARRFGLELGICGVCGSPLTNDVSREYGIGPICRGKTGW